MSITICPPDVTVWPQRAVGACPGSFSCVHAGVSFSSFHNKDQTKIQLS